jgi:hypothetical protein
MPTPNPIKGPDAPNRLEEILFLSGAGFLLAQLLLPSWLGWVALAGAGVSYGLRYYNRHK